MTDTQNIERREVTVRTVFATYTDVVPSLVPGGNPRLVARSAARGETVTIPAQEADRLEALGAIESPDQTAVDAVLERALNPADNIAEGGAAVAGVEPVTVSPPGLGVAPAGDRTKGDTGGEDAQPSATASPGATDASATFDARDASLDDAQAWLRSARPTAPQVVAAANDDPEAAETLLEAERLVRSGDPRKTVEEGLQAVIDGDGSGE
jgi:hypothetical protein